VSLVASMNQTDPITRLALWITPAQRRVMLDLARGEEGAFFSEVAERLADIAQMPKTYEQNGRRAEAIAHLHYFTAGADFYITEKDRGSADDWPDFMSGPKSGPILLPNPQSTISIIIVQNDPGFSRYPGRRTVSAAPTPTARFWA